MKRLSLSYSKLVLRIPFCEGGTHWSAHCEPKLHPTIHSIEPFLPFFSLGIRILAIIDLNNASPVGGNDPSEDT